jgi:hypothetical protein
MVRTSRISQLLVFICLLQNALHLYMKQCRHSNAGANDVNINRLLQWFAWDIRAAKQVPTDGTPHRYSQ